MDKKTFNRLFQHSSTIGIQQNKQELFWLINRVQRIRPEIIVEIGVCEGGTLKMWEEIIPSDGMVVGIDMRRRMNWDITKSTKDIRMIYGDSHSPATLKKLKSFLYKDIDFLFIDGDHTYRGVRADYYDYSPLVRMGGIIGFHDLLCWEPSVGRFFKSLSGEKESLCASIYHGMGIYYKNLISHRKDRNF